MFKKHNGATDQETSKLPLERMVKMASSLA